VRSSCTLHPNDAVAHMPYPIGLTCQELVELVTEYLESNLPADQQTRFDAHLAACPGCAEYLRQMRETINASRSLNEESLQPAARAALVVVFRSWYAGVAETV
jgi:anti-sigma factor RsiW